MTKLGRPRWQAPEGIDWTRPASHLAAEHDVAQNTILSRMREMGLSVRSKGRPRGNGKGQPAKQPKGIWQPPPGVEIDWSQPAWMLAARLKCSSNTILRYMRRTGIPTRRWGHPAKIVDYSKVNWNHTNGYIANVLQVSRECVRQRRAKLGLPASGSAEWRLGRLAALKAARQAGRAAKGCAKSKDSVLHSSPGT